MISQSFSTRVLISNCNWTNKQTNLLLLLRKRREGRAPKFKIERLLSVPTYLDLITYYVLVPTAARLPSSARRPIEGRTDGRCCTDSSNNNQCTASWCTSRTWRLTNTADRICHVCQDQIWKYHQSYNGLCFCTCAWKLLFSFFFPPIRYCFLDEGSSSWSIFIRPQSILNTITTS